MTPEDILKEAGFVEPGLLLPDPVAWPGFWDDEGDDPGDWFAEPLLPAGRQVAIASKAKAGKSLLGLDVAAAKATGRPVLGQPGGVSVDVVYLDLEMTEADLRERLDDLGYGADTDLSRLHYYLLPDLPPLDTRQGGEALLALCERDDARGVVIDTMARAVHGDEDQSDTYRAFYRHTGRGLKEAGVTLCRLDHHGKDSSRGQRGSSAKSDDVDLVWSLAVDGNVPALRATHRRMSWVPQEVKLIRQDEPLRHVWQDDAWPMGTVGVAADLELLGVPVDATFKVANSVLRKNDDEGRGRRKTLVLAALKYRRMRASTVPEPSNPVSESARQEPPGNRANGSADSLLKGPPTVPEPGGNQTTSPSGTGCSSERGTRTGTDPGPSKWMAERGES